MSVQAISGLTISQPVSTQRNVESAKAIGFSSHQSPLKTLFKQGKFPSVTKGLYGDTLTLENTSLEHLDPLSKGGKSVLSNYALASRQKNSNRGNKPLKDVLTWDMLCSYLDQFKFKIKEFNGYLYRNLIFKTCAKQGVVNPKESAIDTTEHLSKKQKRSIRNKQKKLDIMG